MSIIDDLFNFNFTTIAFELTNRCPIRCRSCLRDCTPQKGSVMNFEQIRSVLDNLGKQASFREVGFSGGECFVYVDLLLRVFEYIHNHRKLGISVSTNAFWAESPQKTLRILEPMANCGLKSLLVSIDDFHLEHIQLSYIENCVNTALNLGIRVTLQVITTKTSRKSADFQKIFHINSTNDSSVEWVENPCDPRGRACREVPDTEFQYKYYDKQSVCTILCLISVRLDGTAVPCCGSGADAAGLSVGNVFNEDMDDIIIRANKSPLINSLAIYGGPLQLIKILSQIGHPEFMNRMYTSPCDACYLIFSNREIVAKLESFLANDWLRLYAKRLGYQVKLIDHFRENK